MLSRKKPDLLTQQARLRRRHREKGQVLAIFRKPMWESLTSVLPITAIVLVVTSVRKREGSGQPQALGLNYFREER